MVFAVVRYTVFPLLRWLFIDEIVGLENLPAGPFVVAANHSSYADAPLLLAGLFPRLKRTIHFVVWEKVARVPVVAWWVRHAGGVFENGSVEKSVTLLKEGEIVGIFPEGHRTASGRVQKVTHTGVGVLASQGSVPVIPVKLDGAFELWPRQKWFPRLGRMVSIKVGKPVHFVGGKGKKEYVRFGNRVMDVVKRL